MKQIITVPIPTILCGKLKLITDSIIKKGTPNVKILSANKTIALIPDKTLAESSNNTTSTT